MFVLCFLSASLTSNPECQFVWVVYLFLNLCVHDYPKVCSIFMLDNQLVFAGLDFVLFSDALNQAKRVF